MKGRILNIIGAVTLLIALVGLIYVYRAYSTYRQIQKDHAAQTQAVESVIASRLAAGGSTDTDPFGDDEHLDILLIGLDTRAGSDISHCDAIQLISIDKHTQHVSITAVPRGTYSPLPPGTGTTSSDYYVSNSCALGGIEYGITQIERILGKEADYVAFIGFSELVGALRTLRLPTTETVQWLRHRQGYAIGEPQRAHNHSTFIKQMMVRFTPEHTTAVNTKLYYLLYSLIDTDLSFDQSLTMLGTLSEMELYDHPERITLSMRPAYDVQDIAYDEATAGDYINQMVSPIAPYLSKNDYEQLSESDITAQITSLIAEHTDDADFISWAWNHTLWNQIYDEEARLTLHNDILLSYLQSIEDTETRQAILGDYVLEMEFLGYEAWAEQGRALIAAEVSL